MARTTMTKQLRNLMVEELIDEFSSLIIETGIDIVNAEILENYELCLEIHTNTVNYISDISKLHNELIFNGAADSEEIRKGLMEQYVNVVMRVRKKFED